MTLRPGSLPEYIRRHANPWPELVATIGSHGVRAFSIFDAGQDRLFLYSEIDDPQAWDRVWATDVHQLWGREMEPLLAVDERGAPIVAKMDEIFSFTRSSE